jgi:hypothetical protein
LAVLLAVLPPGGTFIDDDGNIHEGGIEAVFAEGITAGCNPPANDRYCPGQTVTRGQMAAFIARASNLSAAVEDHFADDEGHLFEEAINRLAEAGITLGCNPPLNDRFCPDRKMTRGEMAAMLVRAFHYPAALDDHFVDDGNSIFEEAINRIGDAGVTLGCNPPLNDRYCPEQRIARDQMATFLTRALGLSPNPPPPRFSFPTVKSTGPRVAYSAMEPSRSVTTSHDGQVIDRVDVTGGITIRHDNVTVSDSRINYTGSYGIRVEKVNGVCPKGTVIRYVEIDGSLAADNHAPAYDDSCGYTFDHVHLHDAGTGIRTYGNSVITNSYLVNDTSGPSGAHREPLLVRGSNHVIRNNVLICDVPQGGCSAALAIYGDPYPTTNILVEGNWLAATAAYCAYGGATHTYADEAENVDFFNNAFSNSLTPETSADCGRAGDITAHRNGVDGNESSGNYIYETGRSID